MSNLPVSFAVVPRYVGVGGNRSWWLWEVTGTVGRLAVALPFYWKWEDDFYGTGTPCYMSAHGFYFSAASESTARLDRG